MKSGNSEPNAQPPADKQTTAILFFTPSVAASITTPQTPIPVAHK